MVGAMSQYEQAVMIDVCGTTIPLDVYWRVIDLWNEGKSHEEIVDLMIRRTGHNSPKLFSNLVFNIVDNQQRMSSVSEETIAYNSSSSSKSAKKVSSYRATRNEAKADLAKADETRRGIRDNRKKLDDQLHDAFERMKGTKRKSLMMNDPQVQAMLKAHRALKNLEEFWESQRTINKEFLGPR